MENITFSSVVFFMPFLLIPSSDELPHNYPCVVQWSADRQVCLPDKPATNGLSSREPLPICIFLRNAAGYIPDIFQHVRKAFHVFQPSAGKCVRSTESSGSPVQLPQSISRNKGVVCHGRFLSPTARRTVSITRCKSLLSIASSGISRKRLLILQPAAFPLP